MNNLYGTWETNYANVVSGAATPMDDCLIWTGVTNYPGAKTTKLVMRKVPAKGETWQMGQAGGAFGTSGNAEQVHDTTLTKDYFIGVFPVTQEQYRKLTRGSITSTPRPTVFRYTAIPTNSRTTTWTTAATISSRPTARAHS